MVFLFPGSHRLIYPFLRSLAHISFGALERTSLDDDSLGRAALNQVLELSRRGVEGLKLGRLGAGLIQTGDRLEFPEI